MSTATAGLRTELAQAARQAPVGALTRYGLIALVVGGAAFVWSLMGGHADRAWEGYHTSFLYFTGLAQGLVIFAATQKAARSHWAGLIIRLAEAGVAFVLIAPILYAGLVLGRGHLFAVLPTDRPTVGFWFGQTFYLARNWLLLVAMALLSWRFVRRDMAADIQELAEGRPVESDPDQKLRITQAAVQLLVAWAFCYSLLAFDLIMSLAPRWVSNLFGAFFFMGNFLGALATLGVLTLTMRGPLGIKDKVSTKQLHDLAKLVFGFTVFWAYLMWAQFLVIWYGNLPEETYWIFYRLWGGWRVIGTAVFLLVFVTPFLGLLSARPKKYPPTFALFSLISLLGLWLERYLEIVPSINNGHGPAIGVPEVGAAVMLLGVFLLAYGAFAKKYPMVSPRLAADTLEREHGH
ncbi:MAG TPA: hypothetical protein VNH63_01800 [Gemmatimonadales bacterium]|nr:hypothetical protein [Gemmatimonadales bacterium]